MKKSPKVLLLNPPTDELYNISIQPPLGILYIASYLRSHGITVKVADLNISKVWEKDLQSVLRGFEPTDVGLSSNLSNRSKTLKIALAIKDANKDINVIVGGPHPTIEPDLYIAPSVDYIILHEGEQVMLDFITGKNGDYIDQKDNGREKTRILKSNRIADLDLNDLPFPAYDLIPIDKYYVNSYRRKPLVTMVTSRGCPAGCVFCNQGVFGDRWRARSAENVVAEMEWLEKKIGVRELAICDDNFSADAGRVQEICDLKRLRGNKLVWQLANGVRVDKLTKELLKKMKDAGCWKIAIAPEVGDKESFVKIRKGGTLEKFHQVAEWCKELDIVYYGFFLIGFPFQTQEQINKTINFAIDLDPLIMDMSKVIPFRGTRLYEEYPDHRVCGKDVATYYDRQNDDLVEKLFKRAYYRFYLRPRKIFEIIKKIGVKSFLRFIKYGIKMFYLKK